MSPLNRFSTIAFCFFLLLPLMLQAEPRFQTAENVDCKVHLNHTHSVRWYGPCVDGTAQGIGTAQYLKDQKIVVTYKGNMENGKRHGQGTYVTVEGDKYIGKYKDNSRHGLGTMVWAYYDSRRMKQYVGNWVNDDMHGQGSAIYFNGSKYTGQWANDEPVGLQPTKPVEARTFNSRKEFKLASSGKEKRVLTDTPLTTGKVSIKIRLLKIPEFQDGVTCTVGDSKNNVYVSILRNYDDDAEVPFGAVVNGEIANTTGEVYHFWPWERELEVTVLWKADGIQGLDVNGEGVYQLESAAGISAQISCSVSNAEAEFTVNLTDSDVKLIDS